MDVSTTTVNSNYIHCDLSAGNASNKKILMENQYWNTTTSEQIGNLPLTVNCYNNVAAGANIYCRAQVSGTAQAINVIAYAVGG